MTQAQIDRMNEIETDVNSSTVLTPTQKASFNVSIEVIANAPADWQTYFQQSIEYIGGSRPTKPRLPA